MIEYLFLIPLYLLVFVFLVLVFIFWLVMLLDVVKKDFKKSDDKIMWVLILLFANWIGAVIYYAIVFREERLKRTKFRN
jgi:O-antigen ligase